MFGINSMKAGEKIGTEKLTAALKIIIEWAEKAAKAKEDDKIDAFEWFGLVAHGTKLAQILPWANQIGLEIEDMSMEEREHLLEYFADEFDLENKEAERKIEMAVGCIITIGMLMVEFANRD